MIVVVIATVLINVVLAGFWLLQRHVEQACRMSPAWLERWHRETTR